jgi:uncharacterized protein YecT (DUF1311 family)
MRFIILFLFSNILFSQTQIELNFKAKEKYELINKELITLHNKLLILYKNKLEKKSEIILNHKNWLKKRDTFMNNKYPQNQRKDYGTYFPVRWYNELIVLTDNRIKHLKLNYNL